MKPAIFVCLFLCLFSQATRQEKSIAVSATHALASEVAKEYGKLPLSFESNQGQSDTPVKFFARGAGYSLFLTSREAVLALTPAAARTRPPATSKARPGRDEESAVLRIRLVGSNHMAKVSGSDELPGRTNYFIGNDPKKWHTNVPTYAKVKYESVYPGIDMVYYGKQGKLEYDFVLAPGADPCRIRFDIQSAQTVSRDQSGELVLHSGKSEIRWNKPVVYQQGKDGTREEVAGRYVIEQNRVSFAVSRYDRNRTLVIDPALVYSTFLGGAGGEGATGLALDNFGNTYITGYTSSTNFPTLNALQPVYGGGVQDAFVAKLDPTGSALVYSTYLGGSDTDDAQGIAVDRFGNAYVVGNTYSSDFPTLNALQPVYGGNLDGFVTKLNSTGSALVYSTYLGGSGPEIAEGIAVDSLGKAYVSGTTGSTDFPILNALQPVYGGGSNDGFVSVLNASGSAFAYSTYLGGSGYDGAFRVAVDKSGYAYVAGETQSSDFPTVSPLQPVYGGGTADGFIAKFNPSGSALIYSTYLGGNDIDYVQGIAIDAAGNVYVTGTTCSVNFPLMIPLQLFLEVSVMPS